MMKNVLIETKVNLMTLLRLASFVLIGLSQTVHANSDEEYVSPKSGTLYLESEQSVKTSAINLSTDVSIVITGLTARVKVTQIFENEDNHWVEGRYVFPLPENAAVDRLTMKIGEQIIVGEIQEKQQARKTYEAAKISGRKASLVEQHRANIFSNSVTNIGPYDIIEIAIEYQQDIEYHKDRGFSIRFPMTITPRYEPTSILKESFTSSDLSNSKDGVYNSASQFRVVYPSEENYSNNPPKNNVSIRVQLDAGFSLENLSSSSHSILQQQMSENSFQISLKSPYSKAEKDFVLHWTPTSSAKPRAAIFNEKLDDENFVSIMVLPPSLSQAEAKNISREIIFVIDTSGSMSGESILQAKQALEFGLSTLSSQDRFNIIQFNSTTGKLFKQAVAASTTNLSQAYSYINRLRADGGTEMFTAIDTALYIQQPQHLLRQVIFLTDGAVSNEAQLFELISKKLDGSRLYTVGIGSAPNTFFMKKAALFGRGTFTYIADIKQAKDKMETLFESISSPQLTHINIDWPDRISSESWPQKIPDLYDGEPIWIKAKVSDLIGDVRISGRINNTLWQSDISLVNPKEHSGISVLWAREKIESLMNQSFHGKITTTQQSEITALALKHHLVSRFTSLVAVDKTPSRVHEALRQEKIRNHLPKGTKLKNSNSNKVKSGQHLASNIQFPQTSLDISFISHYSMILFLISFMGLLIVRRL